MYQSAVVSDEQKTLLGGMTGPEDASVRVAVRSFTTSRPLDGLRCEGVGITAERALTWCTHFSRPVAVYTVCRIIPDGTAPRPADDLYQ